MTDCICGFGKGLPDDRQTCPYCGTDLTLLKKIGVLPERFMQQGEALLHAGRTEEAAHVLAAAVALSPALPAARRALAGAYAQKGDSEGAVRLYNEALALDPGDEEVRDALAKAEETREKAAAGEDRRRTRQKTLRVLIPAAAFLIGLALAFVPGLPGAEKGGAAVMAPAQIEASLQQYASLRDAGITVEADGGALKVRGVVPDERTREFVGDVVNSEAGGRRVDLEALTVRAPSLAGIAKRIETAVAKDPALAGAHITARVSGGAIVLSGTAGAGSRDYLTELVAREAGDAAAVVADVVWESAATAYTVRAGDTLYSIAKRFYGDGNEWTRVYEANKGILTAPGTLETGMELTVPAS